MGASTTNLLIDQEVKSILSICLLLMHIITRGGGAGVRLRQSIQKKWPIKELKMEMRPLMEKGLF